MYSLNGSIFKGNRIAVTPYLTSKEYEDAIKRTIIISGFDDEVTVSKNFKDFIKLPSIIKLVTEGIVRPFIIKRGKKKP